MPIDGPNLGPALLWRLAIRVAACDFPCASLVYPGVPRARRVINQVPGEIGRVTRHLIGIHDLEGRGRGSAGRLLKVEHRSAADT